MIRTVFFLALATVLQASSLPGPVTLAECVNPVVIDDPSSCAVTFQNASASGSVELFPFISLTAESNAGPKDGLIDPGSGVFVSGLYSFQVAGGDPGDTVPILITSSLASNASPASAYGFAEVVVETSFGTTSVVVCTNGTCGTTNTSFSGSFDWLAHPGEIGTIHVEAEASSGNSPVAVFANASADPFLSIDPSFAGAANYAVIVSPGVANALPNVPEPGTLGIAAVALACGGLGMRRSTKRRPRLNSQEEVENE